VSTGFSRWGPAVKVSGGTGMEAIWKPLPEAMLTEARLGRMRLSVIPAQDHPPLAWLSLPGKRSLSTDRLTPDP
jgi:hypothetical protein